MYFIDKLLRWVGAEYATGEEWTNNSRKNEEITGKDPDAGKDRRREEKGTTEDKLVGWHHQLDGQESEQALGAGDGQGGLACCSPWVTESDTTERLS